VEIKQGIAEKLQTNLHPEFCLIDWLLPTHLGVAIVFLPLFLFLSILFIFD
jgi:hypothetical protein